MTEQEAIAYIEEWDVTEAAKVLKWYEEDELLRPCDCDTIVEIETENLQAENAKLRKRIHELEMEGSDYFYRTAYAEDANRTLEAKNAKLQELVKFTYAFFAWADGATFSDGTPAVHACDRREVESHMRELGIEVD